MSLFSEALRKFVVARAGERCEYCHLPSRGQVGRFPIDHVVPRTAGGATEADNLALACPRCNGLKWAHGDGLDPSSGELARLFHPRDEDWEDHFRWSASRPHELEGRTATGRATIARLGMNRPEAVEVRRLLVTVGLFPEAAQ